MAGTTPRALVSAQPAAAVEASYGVVSAALKALCTKWYAPTAADIAKIEHQFQSDAEKIKGFARATEHRLTTKSGSIARKFYLATEIWQLYIALMLGEVTSSAASVANDEQQTITKSGAGTTGAFTITFRGATTSSLVYNVTAGAMQTALEALPTIGTGNVTVALVGTVYTLTFGGTLGDRPLVPVTVQADGMDVTLTVAVSVPGLAASIYTHETKFPGVCDLNPPSFPFIEAFACAGFTATRKLYPGCVVRSLSMEASSKEFIQMSAEIATSGQEIDVPTFTMPTTAEDVSDLLGNMVSFYLGPLGTEMIPRNLVRSFKVSMDAGSLVPPIINDVTYATEMQYGVGNPNLEIQLVIQGTKADVYHQYFTLGEFDSRYIFKMVIDPLIAAPYQAPIQLVCSQVLVSASEMGADGNETRLTLTLMPEDNATDDGPGVWTTKTPTAAYLIAT